MTSKGILKASYNAYQLDKLVQVAMRTTSNDASGTIEKHELGNTMR